MSNGDFEVMPLGTMEELRVLRQFSNDMIDISRTLENPVEKWEKMTLLIREFEKFYAYHTEKYVL
jgi:hypothetical protein